MKAVRLLPVALLALLLTSTVSAQILQPTQPEAQGVEPQGIVDFVTAWEQQVDSPHGFVLLRHGHPIAAGWWSPYSADQPHMLYSLSKSFTSTAIGLLYDAGKLDIDNTVVDYFPDKLPPNPSEHLREMRIRDLLTMTSGHHNDTLHAVTMGAGDDWQRNYLAQPVQHPPGTYFRYNTGNTYMLSSIVQKITGQSVLDFLKPRLFEPLGITDATWETDPHGVDCGGWGLSITTNDIARFGQLYLQQGQWNGNQLLSRNWVRLASAAQTPNGSNPQSDWNQGYGFQFWRCRHDCFRGDGAYGQYCIVMPDYDAVLAINSGLGNMQKVLDLVWQHILPAIHDKPLPDDPQADAALTTKLKSLAHPTVQGQPDSRLAKQLDGKTYTLSRNPFDFETVTFHLAASPPAINLHTAHGDQRYTFGYHKWSRQTIHYYHVGIPEAATTADEPVAASAAWTRPNEFTALAWLVAAPFRFDFQFTFDAKNNNALTLRAREFPLQRGYAMIKGQMK